MKAIAELLHLRESRTLEFKRDLSSIQPILKTIVAFANTAGGVLVIGREDQGRIVGVEDVSLCEEKIANAISDSIFPKIFPDIEVCSFEGKPLLVIRVSYWPGPFYLKDKEQGVYIRLGSTNRVASAPFLEEIERAKSHRSFDQLPYPSGDLSDLDAEKIHSAAQTMGCAGDKKFLETLGILVPYQETSFEIGFHEKNAHFLRRFFEKF